MSEHVKIERGEGGRRVGQVIHREDPGVSASPMSVLSASPSKADKAMVTRVKDRLLMIQRNGWVVDVKGNMRDAVTFNGVSVDYLIDLALWACEVRLWELREISTFQVGSYVMDRAGLWPLALKVTRPRGDVAENPHMVWFGDVWAYPENLRPANDEEIRQAMLRDALNGASKEVKAYVDAAQEVVKSHSRAHGLLVSAVAGAAQLDKDEYLEVTRDVGLEDVPVHMQCPLCNWAFSVDLGALRSGRTGECGGCGAGYAPATVGVSGVIQCRWRRRRSRIGRGPGATQEIQIVNPGLGDQA